MDNISLQDLSRVVMTFEHEVKEVSQNTDLDMLEVIEPLQRIHGTLVILMVNSLLLTMKYNMNNRN